jgi:hypothetical protein
MSSHYRGPSKPIHTDVDFSIRAINNFLCQLFVTVKRLSIYFLYPIGRRELGRPRRKGPFLLKTPKMIISKLT